MKLKPRHNLVLFMMEMRVATEKENAEHIMRLAMVIPALLNPATYVQLLTIIHRLWKIMQNMRRK